jgi:hypothetical protein
MTSTTQKKLKIDMREGGWSNRTSPSERSTIKRREREFMT